MGEREKYRKDIQVLRGLAVLAVVLFHADEKRFPLGYLGVDFFFLISGFVVTPLILEIFAQSTGNRELLFNLKNFFKRRFYRLSPAVATMLVLSGLVLFFVGPIVDHEKFAKQGIATLLLLGNFGAYSFSGSYFAPNPNPLLHTWSLSVEEQIYLTLPLVLMLFVLIRRKLKNSIPLFYVVATSLSFLAFLAPTMFSPIYSHIGNGIAAQFSFYSPLSRIWQFTLGGIAYFLLRKNPFDLKRIARPVNILVVAVVLIIIFGPTYLGTRVGTIIASALALLVLLLKSLDILPSFLRRPLVWVGDRSYSIYLVHAPLLYVVAYSPLVATENSIFHEIEVGLAVIASILLGNLSYSKIENRFRIRTENQSHSSISLKSLATLTILLPLVVFLGINQYTSVLEINPKFPGPNPVVATSTDKSCRPLSTQSKVFPAPCHYGEAKDKSIFLFGDSHATADLLTIISLAKSLDMDVYAFAFQGCGFVLSERNFSRSHSYPYLTKDCLQHNREILESIEKIKPAVVIWARRSSSIMVTPNNFRSRTQYNEMMYRDLSTLVKLNQNLVIIGSEPEYLSAATVLQKLFNPEGEYSAIPFEDDRYWKSSKITDYYLSTVDLFCPKGKCAIESSRGLLFKDSDHLSELGARALAPQLEIMIKQILNTSK